MRPVSLKMAEDDQGDHIAQRRRQAQVLGDIRFQREAFVSEGARGWELFERMAGLALAHRMETSRRNGKCSRCWHDAKLRCICDRISSVDRSRLPSRVIFMILMHHKEYMCAGNTAKLLLSMLPEDFVRLFIFGREGDLDRLDEELASHPQHTMVLWPGKDSITLKDFVSSLPPNSSSFTAPSSENDKNPRPQGKAPVLRIVLLDGTYSNAKHMQKILSKRLHDISPRNVALHPKSASIFRRAQKRYAASMTESLRRNGSLDSDAVRISTAEAAALLLTELGAKDDVQESIVAAVVVNNGALLHGPSICN